MPTIEPPIPSGIDILDFSSPTWRVPGHMLQRLCGVFGYILAEVDPYNTLSETDDSNNIASVSAIVTQCPGMGRLVITLITTRDQGSAEWIRGDIFGQGVHWS